MHRIDLFVPTTAPLSWIGESIAEGYPKLDVLTLVGSFELSILTHFPTITDLGICDRSGLLASIHDTFDLTQDVISTTMLRKRSIMAPDRFEEPIRDFCAPRRLLGLTVPEIRIIFNL